MEGGEVYLVGFGEDYYIIYVDKNVPVNALREDAVHDPLEGAMGIGQAQRHLAQFKMPKRGGQRGLHNGIMRHRHLVIVGGKGKGREQACFC